MEICGDNRFEIIAKAKEHLLEATNIDTSEDEMKVLDTFLFRCWQMGWPDRYAEQTEPQMERHLPDYSHEADLGRRIMEQTDCSWKKGE